MVGLPLVVFPHPLHSLSPEQVAARASAVVDEIARVLTEPADRLANEFRQRHLPAQGPLNLSGAALVCEGDFCELR